MKRLGAGEVLGIEKVVRAVSENQVGCRELTGIEKVGRTKEVSGIEKEVSGAKEVSGIGN